jgi:hypothetical protein
LRPTPIPIARYRRTFQEAQTSTAVEKLFRAVLFCAVSDAIGMSHKTRTQDIDARAARCFLLSGRDLTQVVEMAGFEAERALFIRS